MRSRLSDGVVIVLLGLALLSAAVRALPAPPDLRTAATSSYQPMGLHLGSPGHVRSRHEVS